MQKRIIIAIAAALTLLLAGCQSGEQGDAKPQGVEARAQARWDAFVERDFATAWEYYSPGYRQMTPQEVFAADKEGRPIRWRGAQVIDKTCETDAKCTVAVEITYQAVGAPNELSKIEVTRDVSEEWVQVNGQWWFLDN